MDFHILLSKTDYLHFSMSYKLSSVFHNLEVSEISILVAWFFKKSIWTLFAYFKTLRIGKS